VIAAEGRPVAGTHPVVAFARPKVDADGHIVDLN
jgi:hypothetical protein